MLDGTSLVTSDWTEVWVSATQPSSASTAPIASTRPGRRVTAAISATDLDARRADRRRSSRDARAGVMEDLPGAADGRAELPAAGGGATAAGGVRRARAPPTRR